MQNNIGQLQVLMRRIVSEQKAKPPPMSSPTTVGMHADPQPHPLPPALGPSHSSPVVPAHLHPQLSDESVLLPDISLECLSPSGTQANEALPGLEEEDFGLSVDDSSHLTNTTAEQIIELLDRLEMAGSDGQSRNNESKTTDLLMHCKTCTGQLESV